MNRTKVAEALEKLVLTTTSILQERAENGNCPDKEEISAIAYLADTYADITREDY